MGVKSSVGGFAYSAGRSAEFSRNSVLRGAGHCGRNLVDRVCSSRGVSGGVGARAASEGAWGRDGGTVCTQTHRHRSHMAGAHQALCDCRLSQHALSCTWLLPQQRLLSSADFHQHSQNLQCKKKKKKKRKDLSLFYPLSHSIK